MNTVNSSIVSIQSMFRHLPVLRRYARRAVLGDEIFDEFEEQDRQVRMQEYLLTGRSMNWTDCELIALVFREVFSRAGLLDDAQEGEF